MTRKMILAWMAVLGVALLAAPVSAEETQAPKSEKDQLSYSLGAEMGRNLQRQGIEVDLDFVIRGLKDGLSRGELLIPEDDVRKILIALQADVRRKQVQTRRIAGEDNKKAGDAFLAENKTKEGVVTLPSGLQYKILKAGDGKKPTEADTVEVNYRGTLINGTEFDSSYSRGQPATFKVKGGVIPGWTEALLLMPMGSRWQVFVPPQLAYGERGAGRDIGPNATLIFEVELLAIK
jgi:FKBP-type peptidyl-prolyl cis-trans isomerase